ncbi:MAG: dihydroneopterin aldolase [candidate division WOR-3 bacterium]|nr:dihydroneopterin aldolase [candidate division WOR-3 bacterium]
MLTISGIELYTKIGISEEERKGKREIDVDVSIDANKFVDLKEVYNLIKDTVESSSYTFIEDIGKKLLSILADRYTPNSLTVKVRKPHPPIGGRVDYIECEMVYQGKSKA